MPFSRRTNKAIGCLVLATSLCDVSEAASNFKCTPMQVLMTRTVSTQAVSANGAWVGPKFPAENVNTANLLGALKFIMTETIDSATGVTDCQRKNGVAYIDFYLWTICQPNNALWWFSPLKPEGYGGTPQYTYRGLGQYVTFDDGACNSDQEYCAYINGDNKAPKLGNFIGWQDVSTDPRNPTEGAYWYSFPGSCPEQSRSSKKKTPECMAERPSGLCKPGQVPDGVTCTYNYQFLGEVDIDGLVGIKALGYSNYTEFCKAGNVEFERAEDFSFVKGLNFWSDPLNQTRNMERIDAMLQYYSKQPMNLPIPDPKTLNKQNPKCFCNFPACTESTPCKYDFSQSCVPCDPTVNPDCEQFNPSECPNGLPRLLDPVKLQSSSLSQTSGSSSQSSSASGNSQTSGGSSQATVQSGAVSNVVSSYFTAAVTGLLVLHGLAFGLSC